MPPPDPTGKSATKLDANVLAFGSQLAYDLVEQLGMREQELVEILRKPRDRYELPPGRISDVEKNSELKHAEQAYKVARADLVNVVRTELEFRREGRRRWQRRQTLTWLEQVYPEAFNSPQPSAAESPGEAPETST